MIMSDGDETSDENDDTEQKGQNSGDFDDERQKFREQIATMSFEQLQKLQQQVGSKKYNQKLTGDETSKSHRKHVKRANKNRPRETSSKIPINFKTASTAPLKKAPMVRDPRFDPLCGTYDEKQFKSNYKFLKELRKKERAKLEEEYNECEDLKRRKKIKYLMQRIDNQIREQENREKLKEKERAEKKEITDKLKRGERPEFKKKSEKRLEDLISKYEELKKSNKLQKHIERRSKKLAKKRRKNEQDDI